MDKIVWDKIKSNYDFYAGYWYSYVVLFVDLILVCISWKLSFQSGIALVFSYVLLIVALLHFYVLLHEATHSALSKNVNVNNFLGHILGIFILLPFLPRQTSHILHHTWTGHPKRDPANNRVIQKFSVITEKQKQKLEFIWKYWIPMLIINDRIGLWKAPFELLKTGVRSKRVRNEIFWVYIYISTIAVLFLSLFVFGQFKHFLFWYIPGLLVALVLEELINLPHHAETPLLDEQDKALPYWEQHKVTHSCESIPFWSKYLLLNFNYHTAHHLYPNAPWYYLNSLHQEILKVAPQTITGHQTTNELRWSLDNRQRPLLNIMGHYFDRIKNSPT